MTTMRVLKYLKVIFNTKKYSETEEMFIVKTQRGLITKRPLGQILYQRLCCEFSFEIEDAT